MDIPTLRTERLILRPYRLDDFDAYAALNGSPEVMRYIAEAQDRPTAFRAFCAVVGHWHYRGHGIWAVEEIATGKLVGGAGLVRWEGRKDLEVGYILHPGAQGKGYASEASRAALRYAHEVLGARGVVAVIHADNAPSIRVAERLGATWLRDTVEKTVPLRVFGFRDP